MIALALLATLIMPPANEGPVEWCVKSLRDYAEFGSTVCLVAPLKAKAEMDRQARLIMPGEQVDAWLPRINLAADASQQSGQWVLPYAPGTYIVVTRHNKARDLPLGLP